MSIDIENIVSDVVVVDKPNLSHVMSYKNENVIQKFIDEWDVSEDEANEVFDEMKKFLYVARKSNLENFSISVDEPMLIIDKMWHSFIMFTLDYRVFCREYFGGFLHHAPFSRGGLEKQIIEVESQGISFSEYKQSRLERQLDLIDKHLGSDTLRKWYVEYGEKYSPRNINTLRKSVYHEDSQPLASTSSIEHASTKDKAALIKQIIETQASSLYCGMPECGAYCTCNTDKDS